MGTVTTTLNKDYDNACQTLATKQESHKRTEQCAHPAQQQLLLLAPVAVHLHPELHLLGRLLQYLDRTLHLEIICQLLQMSKLSEMQDSIISLNNV